MFAAYAHKFHLKCFGRPELVEVPPGGQQVFEAQALRHPCAYMSRATSCFVPNDVRMGGGEPPFILLTGAALRIDFVFHPGLALASSGQVALLLGCLPCLVHAMTADILRHC